jgi:excisionase family DNA binding protein
VSDILTRPVAEAPRILLRPKEAATALAISSRMLWELTARGELPAIRLPGRGKARALRYAVEDLQRWIQRTKDSQTVQVTEADTEPQTATPRADTGGVA